jgi:hypothetical protein
MNTSTWSTAVRSEEHDAIGIAASDNSRNTRKQESNPLFLSSTKSWRNIRIHNMSNNIQKAEASTSNNVYILDEEHGWVPARVVTMQGETATVSVPLYKTEQAIQSDGNQHAKGFDRREISLKGYAGKVLPLQNVDEDGVLKQVQDMVDLPFLHEVSMLKHIFYMS